MNDRIIEFLRKKDFRFVQELGSGACGRTVILHDAEIEEDFVCKKYSPAYEPLKEELYENFVREIKILYLLNHPNIVRVFTYYLYPDHLTGYIIMELVRGTDIETYVKQHPEQINSIFLQVIEGFDHLEKNAILHRDIRPQNMLVSNDGATKIIDFGFGKRIASTRDFGKSISLNWWCDPPAEFERQIYDYATEVYFVGKLFQKLIIEFGIEQFSYKSLLSRMCVADPDRRIASFSRIKQEILAGKFTDIRFSDAERLAYRNFADDVLRATSGIESSAKYFDDPAEILRKLENIHSNVMLESIVPNNVDIISCFLNGAYYYAKARKISVDNVRSFIDLMRSCSRDKQKIILNNTFSRFDSVKRYDPDPFDDEIPF